MFKKINSLFVTMFGIGKLPKIPGSYASLFTVIFLYLLFNIFSFRADIFLFFLVLVFFISLFSINLFVKDLTNKDPKEVVIDEFIGQSIPIILFEIFHGDRNYSAYEALQIYFWFFLLFRVFDGLKPFPIDYVDKKFKNTFGILFDDILAGFYVVLCLILFMVGRTYLLQ